MEFNIKTEDEDGNIVFEGTLKKNEVEFCLNVGINYLLSIGATPFIREEQESEDTMIGPGSDELQ